MKSFDRSEGPKRFKKWTKNEIFRVLAKPDPLMCMCVLLNLNVLKVF